MIEEDTCDACGGTGKPVSGLPCICGGTGRGQDEKIGLRRKVFELEREIQELKDRLDRLLVEKERILRSKKKD